MAFHLSRRLSASGLLAALCLFTGPARSLQGVPSAEPAAQARPPKAGSRAAQIALAALVAAVAQSPLQAIEPAIASVDAKAQSVKAALTPRLKVDVLMIGDSMSVGGFGDAFQEYLKQHYQSRWALYASCGSSPESWLRGEPDYVTKCGFKAITSKKKYYTDFEDHHPPTPTTTPKIETLLDFHQPSVVIVQLGTNWMDGLERKDFSAEQPHYTAILAKFAAALKSAKSVKQVIWITPPDSSKYSKGTEKNVDVLIRAAAKQYNYTIVNSANMTHYVAGKTGGDGVHYRKEDAYAWAENVQQDLRKKLR